MRNGGSGRAGSTPDIFSLFFPGIISTSSYFSFGSASGFGPHNDDHDVIVIQFHGRKYWHFFRTATSTEKATVQDLVAPTTRDRGQTILLTEGEVMFVPKGTWHDVVA